MTRTAASQPLRGLFKETGAMGLQMFAALHLHALDCHEIGDDRTMEPRPCRWRLC